MTKFAFESTAEIDKKKTGEIFMNIMLIYDFA